jgi:hypothetical protein
MQRPTIQRPMRRRPAGTFDRFQGAVTLPGRRRSQPRRVQAGRRRGSQPARTQRGKGGLARRGGRMLAVTGAGAAIAYFLDRKEGKHRRDQVRERATEMTRRRHEHNGSSPQQAGDVPRVESPMGTPHPTPGAPGTPGMGSTPGAMGG